MSHTDRKLVTAIRRGDEQAFEKLFFEYYEQLCKFVCRYIHSMFIAEELVQEVLANIWEGRAILPENLSLRTYLYQSVKNQALDYIKHEEVIQKYEQEVEIRLYNEGHESESEPITKAGFIEAVQRAIEELPKQSRQIYQLSRTDGFTYPEISEILNISIKTVEYHISNALSILRERLAKYLPVLIFAHIFSQLV